MDAKRRILAHLARRKLATGRERRELGALAGKVRIADDFDAPLPDEVLADFAGRGAR